MTGHRFLGRLLTALLLVGCMTVASYAATITVNADGTGDYPTIQAAIDAAVPGDEVVLQPGTYTGDGCTPIQYNGKAITLRGTNPDDPAVVAATIIDGRGALDVIRFWEQQEGRDSVLAGVTVTGGSGDSMMWHNSAILCVGSPTIRNCVIRGCLSNAIGVAGDPLIQDCIVEDNHGSGVHVISGSPVVEGCTIRRCEESPLVCLEGNPVLSRCTIHNNTGLWAAAVGLLGGAATLQDCIIRDNVVTMTPLGPACTFGLYGGSLTVMNCTITCNSGGFARLRDEDTSSEHPHGPLVVCNTILWSNPDGQLLPDPAASVAPVEVSYCVVEGGCAGTGILNVDPQLLPDGRLSAGSPCINAGDPAFVPPAGAADILGQPRLFAGRIDIGADEFTVPGDIDGDAQVNAFDLQLLAESWNRNVDEIGYDPRCDLDGNGIVIAFDLRILGGSWNKP